MYPVEKKGVNMKITRKQAILRAIEVLSENKENQEFCNVLEDLLEELPLSHWTEHSILDAIDQFLYENDSLPAAVDFLKVEYLPSRCTIKNKLGLNMEEFYQKYYNNFYYNNNSIYNYKDIDYWTNMFKEQYIKHGKPGLSYFDKLRDDGTPCVQTYCKIIGVSTWNELLTHCNFPLVGENIYSKVRPERKTGNYSIVCNFSLDSDAEKIKETNEKITKIISNKTTKSY